MTLKHHTTIQPLLKHIQKIIHTLLTNTLRINVGFLIVFTDL